MESANTRRGQTISKMFIIMRLMVFHRTSNNITYLATCGSSLKYITVHIIIKPTVVL